MTSWDETALCDLFIQDENLF